MKNYDLFYRLADGSNELVRINFNQYTHEQAISMIHEWNKQFPDEPCIKLVCTDYNYVVYLNKIIYQQENQTDEK